MHSPHGMQAMYLHFVVFFLLFHCLSEACQLMLEVCLSHHKLIYLSALLLHLLLLRLGQRHLGVQMHMYQIVPPKSVCEVKMQLNT